MRYALYSFQLYGLTAQHPAYILSGVNTMSHGREKRPHEMHAHCERGGIAYIAICGRSKVIWRVTTRTPRTLRTRVLHFLYLFPIYYLHNIFIITNHHRIIISKNSPAKAYVLSNLSEVSSVKYCTHDLQAVSGNIGCTVKKYAACAASGHKPRAVRYSVLFSGLDILRQKSFPFCAESSAVVSYHSLFCSPVRPLRYNRKHYFLDSAVHRRPCG